MPRTVLRTATLEDPPVISPGDFPVSHGVVGRVVDRAGPSSTRGLGVDVPQVLICVLSCVFHQALQGRLVKW